MPKKNKFILSLDRKKCKTLVGAITGHCLIGAHAYKLRIISNNWCRNCNEPDVTETIEHLLCHCPALARQRFKSLGEPFYNSFADSKTANLKNITHFIEKTETFELDKFHEERTLMFN